MIYFTSDTHFGHRNIIKYSKRPFNSVEEMDEALITNWNERVQPTDEIYHLGDFAFKGSNSQEVMDRLNGKKHLVRGNHDPKHRENQLRGWEWIKDYYLLRYNGEKIILFHYGLRVWDCSHYGSIALYGHSHGGLPGNDQSLDVGTDCWNYRPVTLAEIKARLATLPPYPGFRVKKEE